MHTQRLSTQYEYTNIRATAATVYVIVYVEHLQWSSLHLPIQDSRHWHAHSYLLSKSTFEYDNLYVEGDCNIKNDTRTDTKSCTIGQDLKIFCSGLAQVIDNIMISVPPVP